MIKEIAIFTKERYELVDITKEVEKAVKESKINDGLVLIFVPHSTCAILLTENEKGLKRDILKFLNKIVSGFEFEHNRIDDNADSHILSSIIGQERVMIIEKGEILRGTWQNIFLLELDGPRQRRVLIKLYKIS
jgi:secondary thiamine-phosphate synthase enzyme